jgi:predicted ATPase
VIDAMFAHIDFKNLAQSENFGYAASVPFFKKKKQLAFKPGLNILYGPNGCGKTTVLKMLGDTLCATQGGASTVTERVIHQEIDMGFGNRVMRDKIGLTVAHDGQPVVFCDPRNAGGMVSGQLDNDFFKQGVREITTRASHGEKSMHRGNAVFGLLDGKLPFPSAIARHIVSNQVNEVWQEALAVLDKRFVPSVTVGQPTVLLDEPEANFSIDWQVKLWKLLGDPKVAERFQIIVATHSVFALGLAHAHYIDFHKGYRPDIEQFLRHRFAPAPSEA